MSLGAHEEEYVTYHRLIAENSAELRLRKSLVIKTYALIKILLNINIILIEKVEVPAPWVPSIPGTGWLQSEGSPLAWGWQRAVEEAT